MADIECLLAWRRGNGPFPEPLNPAVRTYLVSKGLDYDDLALLDALFAGVGSEKDIAAALDLSPPMVRKRFERIRRRLGARDQVDLGRILGVLSCFDRRRPGRTFNGGNDNR
ncbi:MAG: hypothetical protein PHU25_12995 [Deltaproteobacteria bacterium]|nr:hypothetical protein [Deltaproteobacteria bacterium]